MPHHEMTWAASLVPHQRWLRGLVLPPRGTVGSRKNLERSRTVAAALHQCRIANLPSEHKRAHRIGCTLCQVKLRYEPGSDPRK